MCDDAGDGREVALWLSTMRRRTVYSDIAQGVAFFISPEFYCVSKRQEGRGDIMKCVFRARTILVAVSLVVAAVTASNAASVRSINVLTGGVSGVYYPLGVKLAQIFGKAIPEVRVSVQATKASAEN